MFFRRKQTAISDQCPAYWRHRAAVLKRQLHDLRERCENAERRAAEAESDRDTLAEMIRDGDV